MSLSVRIGLASLVALLILAFVGYGALLRLNVLPRLAFAPGWVLTDQFAERFTSEDLRGTITLYTFDYSANEDPRRQTHDLMSDVQNRLAEQDLGDIPVRLVTVTIDPTRDTPDILRTVGEDRNADFSRWTFATGDSTSIRVAVNHGFGVYYEPGPDGGVSYDPTFIIVDGMGIERARYRYGLPSADNVVDDLLSVVREAQAATGSGRLAYEAAHLFSCYSTTPS